MATTVSTNILITDILAGEALNLYGSTHPHAIAIREMIKDANGDIDLENTQVQGMLALLVSDNILTSAVQTRVVAWITSQQPSKLYDVSRVSGNIDVWILDNKQPSSVTTTRIDEIVTLNGTLPSPAREVI